jgi:hypothetical protein
MEKKLIIYKKALADLIKARERHIKVYGCTECSYMKSLDRKISNLKQKIRESEASDGKPT